VATRSSTPSRAHWSRAWEAESAPPEDGPWSFWSDEAPHGEGPGNSGEVAGKEPREESAANTRATPCTTPLQAPRPRQTPRRNPASRWPSERPACGVARLELAPAQ